MTSITYIQKSIDKKLSEKTYIACYNLSAMLGDSNGYLSRNAIKMILKGMNVTSPGTVLVGDTGGVIVDESSALPPLYYDNEISAPAFDLYTKLKSNTSDLVIETISIDSPLLNLVDVNTPTYIKIVINTLYLEALAIYFDVLFATEADGVSNISMSDLDRVSNNLRWVSDQIERQPKVPYNLVAIIRELHRTVAYIRSLTFLFKETYSSKLRRSSNVTI